jgi:hypothetical protein
MPVSRSKHQAKSLIVDQMLFNDKRIGGADGLLEQPARRGL